MEYETLVVTEYENIVLIELNRPNKANAINHVMWTELKQVFEWLDATHKMRVGVLSAKGKYFTSGIDLTFLNSIKVEISQISEGYKQEHLRGIIFELQSAVSAIEKCRKPVLAAVDGICYGGGIDIITACDMRYATQDAMFSVAEVDVAIVADLGTLQRLPSLIGEGLTRELAYTGRKFSGQDAQAMGLVNRSFETKENLLESVLTIAEEIAAKSPLTIRGIKEELNYSRDHSVAEGLHHCALRNTAMVFSADIEEAMLAKIQNREAVFKE